MSATGAPVQRVRVGLCSPLSPSPWQREGRGEGRNSSHPIFPERKKAHANVPLFSSIHGNTLQPQSLP